MYTLNDFDVYIFNWKKVSTNSLQLYDKISKVIPHTYMINCDEHIVLPSHVTKIQLDDSHYYGSQYQHAIRHAREGSIFCVIVGDNITDNNFEKLFLRALKVFNTYNVGVYSPNDKRSPHTKRLECIGQDLYNVINTDCGFWFIHPSIVSQMRHIDYSISKYGWGIDIMTIEHARKQGMLVIRDYSISTDQLDHTCGYNNKEAAQQMKQLLSINIDNKQQDK